MNKAIIFRIPENLKMDFRIALLKNNISIQHLCEAFTEFFVAWNSGEKTTDIMKQIVKRAKVLSGDV